MCRIFWVLGSKKERKYFTFPLKIKRKRKRMKEKLIDRKEGEIMAILDFLPEKNWIMKKRVKLIIDIKTPYMMNKKKVSWLKKVRSMWRLILRSEIRSERRQLKKIPLIRELMATFRNFISKRNYHYFIQRSMEEA